MKKKASGKKGFTLIELMIVIAIIAILAAILVPNFLKARAQGMITACEANVKNIGTACEMYATDNSSRYPTAKADLSTQNYLRAIPTCPSSGAADSYGYSASSIPDMYTVFCSGSNAHTTVGSSTGYPQYNPVTGLKVR